MLRIQVSRHSYGKPAAMTGQQVRSDERPNGRQVDRQDLQRSDSRYMSSSCVQVPQTEDGYSVVIYTWSDQYCCSVSLCNPVCTLANIVCSQTYFSPEMRLSQETYVDSVLTEVIIQFQLPAANYINVPAGQPQGFLPVGRQGRAVILG